MYGFPLLINKLLNADEVNSDPERCSQPRINIKKGEARFLTLINMNISTQSTQTLMALSRYNQHQPPYESCIYVLLGFNCRVPIAEPKLHILHTALTSRMHENDPKLNKHSAS